MQPRPLVVLVVAAVAVAVAWWQQNGAGSPPALCLVDPIYEAKPGQQTECFFSPSFQQVSSPSRDTPAVVSLLASAYLIHTNTFIF